MSGFSIEDALEQKFGITNVERLRMQLRREPNIRFVAWADFCSLLVSKLQLERINDPDARVVGLKEASTGICYFIEVEALRPPLIRELSIGTPVQSRRSIDAAVATL